MDLIVQDICLKPNREENDIHEECRIDASRKS